LIDVGTFVDGIDAGAVTTDEGMVTVDGTSTVGIPITAVD
jgi:hypothetical protein